jgi:hypothetical protein
MIAWTASAPAGGGVARTLSDGRSLAAFVALDAFAALAVFRFPLVRPRFGAFFAAIGELSRRPAGPSKKTVGDPALSRRSVSLATF